VGQVLPVLTQVFYAPPKSTVLMEQPEIHLHPGVQAELADLFIAAINAREESAPRDVQLIIESHSEHLLRRLLRRIAEEELRESDVAMYFCSPADAGATIGRLEVDSYGDIRNWPIDFFGDELDDVSAQAERALRRRVEVAGR
jgi:predicted ATPase